jgi:glucan phosphoethanolaminetransferase (alkaline phosphatase superfamily)
MKKNTDFINWLFEKKDIDGLIIAFLISASVNSFITDFTVGFVDPIINGLLPTNDNETKQVLNIKDIIIIEFKLQYIISGLIRLTITLILAYFIVIYIFHLFSIN